MDFIQLENMCFSTFHNANAIDFHNVLAHLMGAHKTQQNHKV